MRLKDACFCALLCAIVTISSEPSAANQNVHMPMRQGRAILNVNVRWQPPAHKPKLIEFNAPGAATVVSTACAEPNGGCGTQAYDNNAEGAVVGYYTDAKVVPHGFIRYPNGWFASFDAPGAGLGAGLNEGTVAIGVNDVYGIAGQYQDPQLRFHAFIRAPNGRFTTFEAPGAGSAAGLGTFATNINLEGDTAGVYYDSKSVEHSFVRSATGKITTFDAPGSVAPPGSFSGTMICMETCLNAAGTSTGYYPDAKGIIHGFIRTRNGQMTEFEAPGAAMASAYQGTYAASIDSEGAVAGYYNDATFTPHGFVRFPNGSFITYDVPGVSTGTVPFSINACGVSAGAYLDMNGAIHGFSRTLDGKFAKFDAPGAGIGANQGTRVTTNNFSGAVTGFWIDSANLFHGFIWMP